MLLADGVIAVGQREERSDAAGQVVVERLAQRIALFRTSGYLSDELDYFARSRNVAILDELVAGGEPPEFQGYYDWSGITGYSAGARREATSFILARRKQFAVAYILFKAPLVAMAINVANLLMGGFVQGTTSREEFDARLKRALDSG